MLMCVFIIISVFHFLVVKKVEKVGESEEKQKKSTPDDTTPSAKKSRVKPTRPETRPDE